MQGYYFCRPVPPAELGELLRSGHRLDSNSAA
jgi:EAL domain-containing protein (putative c-di-GMP-specific phosphodiesterase class I)